MYIINKRSRGRQRWRLAAYGIIELVSLGLALVDNNQNFFRAAAALVPVFGILMYTDASYYDIYVDNGDFYIGNFYRDTLKAPVALYAGLEGNVYRPYRGRRVQYAILQLKDGRSFTFDVRGDFDNSDEMTAFLQQHFHAYLFPA